MMPTFIIIGAPRSGTTSLYYYLRQHPEITMSRVKETNYFSYLASLVEKEYEIKPISGWEVSTRPAYESLFVKNLRTRAIGEATPFYLYVPGVPRQIYHQIPNVKLILILRNPIDRAYSTYLKNCREGLETRPFEDAIRQELQHPGKVVRSEFYYARAGLYTQHITRYLEFFHKDQFKLIFQDDLLRSPQTLLSDLFSFLGVDATFVPDTSVRFNQAIPPLLMKKNSSRIWLKSFSRQVRRYIPQSLYFPLLKLKYAVNKRVRSYPELSKNMQVLLRDFYEQDVQALQTFTGRDLSSWLEVT